MSDIGKPEKVTQKRVISLFQKQLGYEYLGDWQYRENSNIEEEYLKAYLKKQGYDKGLITKTLRELVNCATNQVDDLYTVNKEFYTLIRYGVKVKAEIGENTKTVNVIDWQNIENNEFAVAEEVSVKGEYNSRPDLVIYVNGIALGIIELKRGRVSVTKGIRQLIRYQENRYIKPFFHTLQLLIAGNDPEGTRYAVINTPEKYYLKWKEPGYSDEHEINRLDAHLKFLCNKQRFLEIIYDFIVYDAGVKKVCRHNQYFAVKAAQEFIKRREGGIIWHTQGSGKSLIMVYLARWRIENIVDSRVLIITDRDELDKQIEKVFAGVGEDIKRTKSGADLLDELNSHETSILCSLIHKFGGKEEADYDAYINDVLSKLPKNFRAKGDIYVFVDECHRTQSGKLHSAMKKILPNSLFIGFTGTPLLKQDKLTSIETFGRYIHTYKFDEAVADGVVVDLLYEARYIDQNITTQEKIDTWFETKTRGLSDIALNRLKQRWATLKKVFSSKSRLAKIVSDIIFDFDTKARLMDGKGNALLVAGSIYEACKYYELFQNSNFEKCAIITSYDPNIKDIRDESTGEERETERLEKYEIYTQMLNGKDPKKFEDDVKKRFVEEPANMKLLIVVDKLLTGFDAPAATYLYIDKSMKDHGLFQAICRVNRIDGKDKEYGFIIDYKDLFKSLKKSIGDYTSEAFAGYDKKDIEDLLNNRIKKCRKRLDDRLEQLRALTEPVKEPRNLSDYVAFLGSPAIADTEESQKKRNTFYKYVSSLTRAYSELAMDMDKAGYTDKQTKDIKKEVNHYEDARMEIQLYYADYVDWKRYEAAMRHLIDTYLDAKDSVKLSDFDDLTLVDLIINKGVKALDSLPDDMKKDKEAVAEAIENNIRKVITDDMPINPKYYEKMSKLLEELVSSGKIRQWNIKSILINSLNLQTGLKTRQKMIIRLKWIQKLNALCMITLKKIKALLLKFTKKYYQILRMAGVITIKNALW